MVPVCLHVLLAMLRLMLPAITAVAVLVYFVFILGFAGTVYWIAELAGRKDR